MLKLASLYRIFVVMITLITGAISATPLSWGELAIVNQTGDPVVVKFKRSPQGPFFTKLLEVQEGQNFGHVAEVLLEGTRLINTAPAEVQIFPPASLQVAKGKKDCIITIKGAKNRGLMSPFGEWDIDCSSSESIDTTLPIIALPAPDKIYNSFPTVGRKLMPTPRYILGLPSTAMAADAVEAETIVSQRWLALKGEDMQKDKTILEVVQLLNAARKAFEQGMPDEPLSFANEIGIK